MTWFLTIVVKAVLEWLTSLLAKLRERQENIEKGRREVLDAIDDTNKRAEDELKKLGEARANITDDDIAGELRDGYNHYR